MTPSLNIPVYLTNNLECGQNYFFSNCKTLSFSRCKEKLKVVFKKVEAGISEKNTQVEEDDNPMAD